MTQDDALTEAVRRYPAHDPTGREDFIAGAVWRDGVASAGQTQREPTAESRTGMTPMDTTREALWTQIEAFARSDSARHFQKRDIQALIDYEVAAGVAEVERRTNALTAVARLVVRKRDELSIDLLAAALASIDGAP